MEPILSKLSGLLSNDREVVATHPGRWICGTDLEAEAALLLKAIAAAPHAAVGVVCATGPRFLAALLAAINSGRPQVLFGAKWPTTELRTMLGESPCSVWIAEAGQFADFADPDWECREIGAYRVWLKWGWQGECPKGEWLGQFTSGTTGKSRLVIREWRAVGDEIEALEAVTNVPEQGIFLTMAPLHHSYGFCGGFVWPLIRGSKVFTVNDFYPSACRKIWRELRPSVVYGLPFQYEFLATAPEDETMPPPVLALSAGSPLTREVRAKALQRLGVQLSNNYGSTETGTICIYPHMPLDSDEHVAGYPLPGRVLRLDEQGQLLLTSGGTMRGYYREPPVGHQYPTGDKGSLSEDGCVRLLGRLRPIINVGGEKVSPEKVEAALKLHPDIAEAIVMPGAAAGFYHQVKAFVEPKPASVLSHDEVIRHCRKYLFPVEVPKVVHILERIPRSETGKILGKYLMNDWTPAGKE